MEAINNITVRTAKIFFANVDRPLILVINAMQRPAEINAAMPNIDCIFAAAVNMSRIGSKIEDVVGDTFGHEGGDKRIY